MDHYAADVAAVVEHLDLRNAIHIGHSTGGGEATRYAARHGKGRVAKVVLIGAVPPIMVKTPANPGGLPLDVFDGMRQQLAANRAQFYLDFASGPFYGFNRAGATVRTPGTGYSESPVEAVRAVLPAYRSELEQVRAKVGCVPWIGELSFKITSAGAWLLPFLSRASNP